LYIASNIASIVYLLSITLESTLCCI